MAWTDERVELLKKYWAEGLSASQIANKMGGVTRNAVIGKVHRLGLSGRATPAKPSRGRAVEAGPAPRPVAEKPVPVKPSAPSHPVIEPATVIEPAVLSSGDLTTVATLNRNMCKWPIGDPAKDDFHFCGQPAQQGKPYCTHHANVAFQPAQRRADRRPEPRPIRALTAGPKRAAG
ncbi:MAG: GcrA family cell cycle regulator [Pseudomonadota bacterium]